MFLVSIAISLALFKKKNYTDQLVVPISNLIRTNLLCYQSETLNQVSFIISIITLYLTFYLFLNILKTLKDAFSQFFLLVKTSTSFIYEKKG